MSKDEADTRLWMPAGTEIKTHQTQLKCASYLQPFFFMMFPRTTSALQRGEMAWLKMGKSYNDKNV